MNRWNHSEQCEEHEADNDFYFERAAEVSAWG
jgi:hypothetical protein